VVGPFEAAPDLDGPAGFAAGLAAGFDGASFFCA